jgi:hypothetical protein
MRTRLVLLIAAATALTTTVAPISSAMATTAHDVLTRSHVGGPNVAAGDTIKAHLEAGTQATFYAPGTTDGVTCTSVRTISTVSANPLAPGTADESLNAQILNGCSSNIPEVSLVSIKVLGLPYTVTVSDAEGDPVTIANASTKAVFETPIGHITCTFSDPEVDGNASNTGQTLTFSNQEFVLTSGPTACPPAGDFTATLGPNRDTSVANNPRLYVN